MPSTTTLPDPLLPLDADAARLETVGGKGANLAILRRNGLPVPAGFFVVVVFDNSRHPYSPLSR